MCAKVVCGGGDWALVSAWARPGCSCMDCCIGISLIGISCMLPPAPNLTLLVFCMHLVSGEVSPGMNVSEGHGNLHWFSWNPSDCLSGACDG